jgi:hypothetical protein
MTDEPVTREEVSIALNYLAWVREHAGKMPRKKLRSLVNDAKDAEILGWRLLAGYELDHDLESVLAIVTEAGLPLHAKQKRARGQPKRNRVLVGDKWILDHLDATSDAKRVRTVVRRAVAKGLLPVRPLDGQFNARLIEMMESPAYRVLSLSARRVLDRIKIELAQHGGNDNGKLPVTYEHFIEYGVHRHAVAAVLQELRRC